MTWIDYLTRRFVRVGRICQWRGIAFAVCFAVGSADCLARTETCEINSTHQAQDRAIFRMAGIAGRTARVTARLWIDVNGRHEMRTGPVYELRDASSRDYSLPFDVSFGLNDATWKLLKLELVPEPADADFRVSSFKVIKPDDAQSEGGAPLIVHVRPRPFVTPSPGALKVYFHFDNADFDTEFCGGDFVWVKDNNPYPGYRWWLIHAVEKDVRIVRSPEEADAVVYASARPDPAMASRIAEVVKAGKPLVAFAHVADPEVSALLPAERTERKREDLPARAPLVASPQADGLFRGLSTAAFGVYGRTVAKPGAEVLLSYANGEPVVVRRGRVVYSALTVGAEIIPEKTSPDAFLLRLLADLTGHAIPEADLSRPKPDADGWWKGAGDENFGRFGIVLGDGLTCEECDNALEFRNGLAEYAFVSEVSRRIKLFDWTIREKPEAAPRAVKSDYRWQVVGPVTHETRVVVPESWRGNPVLFRAEGGIDDVATVYFNDVKIGEVTEKDHLYWLKPHRHAVPADIVRWGAENTIRIESVNLRGEGLFGATPELSVPGDGAGDRASHLNVDRINHLGKGGVITDGYGRRRRYDTSLAFPGTRWEVFAPSVVLTLNVGGRLAVPTAAGVKTLDLEKSGEIDVAALTEPWVLVYPETAGRPLLVTFAHRPASLTALRTGEKLAGLKFIADTRGEVGMILPIWIGGAHDVRCDLWKDGVPEDMIRRIRFWYPKAFCYPTACTEHFRIHERVEIETRYRYVRTENDWGVKPPPYAPVQALAHFTKGTLFASETVRGTDLMTQYGPFALEENSEIAHWSLAKPIECFEMTPAVAGAREKEMSVVNGVYSNAVERTSGGGSTIWSWTAAYPRGEKNPKCTTLPMHYWLHGVNNALTAPCGLTAYNRRMLGLRLNLMFCSPIEQFRYKTAIRWREEPFSGARYPVWFPSGNNHTHSTVFAPGTGTGINHGDVNETEFVILAAFQQLADRHGQADLVRANLGFVREAAMLALVEDDWGYMASSCRESGQSSTIDMLNCEYAAMMKLARIGEICGDESLRQQGLYRAARRQVPTIARLAFADFANGNGLLREGAKADLGVGFTEGGLHYRGGDRFTPCANDIFDISQGVAAELIDLKKRYGGAPLQTYLRDHVAPYLDKSIGSRPVSETGLFIASLADCAGPWLSKAELEGLLRKLLSDEKGLWQAHWDWPGLELPHAMNEILARLEDTVRVKTAKDLDVRRLEWFPRSRRLEIDLVAGRNPVLEINAPEGVRTVKLVPGEKRSLSFDL